MPQLKLSVGAKVRWTSSNTRKVGVVTHVVPARQLPRDVGVALDGTGSPRDHETYVVRGQKLSWKAGNSPFGPTANYWPRVSLLELDGAI